MDYTAIIEPAVDERGGRFYKGSIRRGTRVIPAPHTDSHCRMYTTKKLHRYIMEQKYLDYLEK